MSASFEHKVLKCKQTWKGFDYEGLEQELDELGRHGWQAVGTIAPALGSGHTHEIVIVLTRSRD
ncbi:DUF4177 domain-containing protein [Saccharopolyspora sp. NPDC002578]